MYFSLSKKLFYALFLTYSELFSRVSLIFLRRKYLCIEILRRVFYNIYRKRDTFHGLTVKYRLQTKLFITQRKRGDILNVKNKRKLSPITAKVLIYSLFACLCHGITVYFFTLHNPYDLTAYDLISTATYMLEHTMMSILLTLIGTFLLEIIQKQKNE